MGARLEVGNIICIDVLALEAADSSFAVSYDGVHLLN